MYQLKTIVNKLEENLNEFNISETVAIKICNEQKYQFQINNLVKYQKHKQINDIITSTIKIIEETDIINSFEVTDKNFINLEINVSKFQYTFKNIRKAIKLENQKNIIIDYGGPNIGKPLHVGHLRSLNIGRSLYQINKFAGHKVLNDIHLGDWGMPVALIICYIDEHNILNEVKPSNIDEDVVKSSLLKEKASPELISKNLAELKANKISGKFTDNLVLGADSVIDLDGELISKPENREEALEILKNLMVKNII